MGLAGTRVPASGTRLWADMYYGTEAARPPMRMKLPLYGPGIRRPDAAEARVQELCLENLGRLVVHQRPQL